MMEQVKKTIGEYRLLEYGDRVIAGVSGGADSVCLFFVLLALREEYGLKLFVVHVNHGLRGEESNKDEEFVRRLCEEHEVSFRCERVQADRTAKEEKISEEEAGRKLRYFAFESECQRQSGNKIAVAHNENDLAETVLFQLFRGSGLKGLSGIPLKRGKIIRPLLFVTRKEIEEYLFAHGIVYRVDGTNGEDIYSRNKIRLNVLPYITREINKKAVEHIARSACFISEAEQYLEEEARLNYEKIVCWEDKSLCCSVSGLVRLAPIIGKMVIRIMLQELAGKLKDITYAHINAIYDLIKKEVGSSVDIPYGLKAERTYKEIVLKHAGDAVEKETHFPPICVRVPGVYTLPFSEYAVSFELKKYKKSEDIPKNSYTKWFDYDKIKNVVLIRTRKTGDFFTINEKGQHKTIKSYFIDNKIPREQRDRIPLLAEGNHIIWIVGGRISEAYKVDENTKTILVVKIIGGKSDVREN